MVSSPSFFKRSLIAAVAMASLSGVSSVAYAANLANLSTTQWSSKSTDLGSFGAGYGANFSMDLTEQGALAGEAAANASIQLFGTTMSIVNLQATANINDDNAEAASVLAEVVGVEVFTDSWNDGITFDASEDVTDYDDTFCVEFFDVSSTFTLVVVPITISAGAEGCANLTFAATPYYNTSTHQGILDMELTPGVEVTLEVSVGAGTSAFSAGVEAEVTLLDLSVPITLNPSYDFDASSNPFDYDTTGQIALNMLDGSVSLYAKADFGLWDVKYSKELFDWNGISKEWYLWSSGEPTASSPMATINSGTATGTYSYEDTAGTTEGNSTYVWSRATSAAGAGSTPISGSTSSSRILVEADSEKYLQFCVTPKNQTGTPGPQQCSDWAYVGKVASFYQHSSYGGNNLAIAYENATSGTCFTLEDNGSSYDNWTSSYNLYAPSNSSATFHFYKDTTCSNTSSSEYMTQTVSAGGMYPNTYVGSSWNDRLSSFKVIFNEKVEADDVTVSISENEANAAYSFNVGNSANTTESGSTYVWYRATNSSGAGSSTISGSTGITHTLGYADDMKYLQVCVTPSNGYTTGTQVCSEWSAVGRLLKMFEDSNQGGDQLAIAWEKSPRETCFNMTDYGFNDKISSFNWYNNAVASSTIWFYKDANCSGTVATRTVAAGSSEQVTSTSNAMGSAWQDSISSFKVSWDSTVAISTPSITILGHMASESHTYSDSVGAPESAKYTWFRASDANGTSSTVITNALSNSYALTASDNKQYLKVCVFSSNGWNVDENELCSSWASVGSLLRIFRDNNEGGTDMNVAYQKTASGTCIHLADMSFDNQASSMRLFAPTGSHATIHRYQTGNCNGPVMSSTAPPNATLGFNMYETWDNNVSSIKIVY